MIVSGNRPTSHRGARPSTERYDGGICPGRHCVAAGLVLPHRHFGFPLHPIDNCPPLLDSLLRRTA